VKEHCVVVGWDLPGHRRNSASSGPFTIEDLADSVEALRTRLTREHQIPAITPVLAAGVSVAGAVSLTLALRPETLINGLDPDCLGPPARPSPSPQ
jgi:3-oxoadipate enol-lactonase